MLEREVFNEVVVKLLKGETVENFEHQGYKLNTDKKHVDLIVEGIKNKESHCPCRVQRIPENVCVCEDFVNNGHCCCKLWVKVDE